MADHKNMPLVVIESPYRHHDITEVETNLVYARLALRNSLERGEAPYASHLLLTQITDEETERDWGINAGFAWGSKADYIAIYIDLGVTQGMIRGAKIARDRGQGIFLRTLQGNQNLHFLETDRLIGNWQRALDEARTKLHG